MGARADPKAAAKEVLQTFLKNPVLMLGTLQRQPVMALKHLMSGKAKVGKTEADLVPCTVPTPTVCGGVGFIDDEEDDAARPRVGCGSFTVTEFSLCPVEELDGADDWSYFEPGDDQLWIRGNQIERRGATVSWTYPEFDVLAPMMGVWSDGEGAEAPSFVLHCTWSDQPTEPPPIPGMPPLMLPAPKSSTIQVTYDSESDCWKGLWSIIDEKGKLAKSWGVRMRLADSEEASARAMQLFDIIPGEQEMMMQQAAQQGGQ